MGMGIFFSDGDHKSTTSLHVERYTLHVKSNRSVATFPSHCPSIKQRANLQQLYFDGNRP